MRSSVRASLALAVLLLVGPGRGRTVPVGRLVRREGQPDLTEVVDAPVVALAAEEVKTDVEVDVDSQPEDSDTELTEVDYDPMVDGYQSNTLDSLGVTQEKLDKLREAYADRTDIHPYFTRENIYSAKTGFDVYLEDDGDVHINVRIPGLRETIDVDTKLSEEDLNENGQAGGGGTLVAQGFGVPILPRSPPTPPRIRTPPSTSTRARWTRSQNPR